MYVMLDKILVLLDGPDLGYKNPTANLIRLGPHELCVVTDNEVLAEMKILNSLLLLTTNLGSQASTTVALKSYTSSNHPWAFPVQFCLVEGRGRLCQARF